MESTFEAALRIAHALLSVRKSPTPEDMNDVVDQALSVITGVDREKLLKELETRYSVLVEGFSVLTDDQYHPWLSAKKAHIEWGFWLRYRRFLEEVKQIPPRVVSRLDEITDTILDHLRDPQDKGKWDRRGLVVGEVQSGKTSNYIGLICKAMDAGYKLTIVLAGVHNSLRSQTQLRIDEGFLGFDTRLNLAYDKTNQRVGAGAIPGEKLLVAHSLTSSNDNGDFSRRVASSTCVVPGGKDPVVLVVKKNVSVLTNLLSWAPSVQGVEDPFKPGKLIVQDVPLLVIDDESDLASINTNDFLDEDGNPIPDNDPTKINKLIRQLLDSFEQSCYVGYTATPFANVFIHHEATANGVGDDLFPDSFIINLPAPSNYIGPATVFGLEAEEVDPPSEGLPTLRLIHDSEDIFPPRHDKHLRVSQLPISMHEAIHCFLLSSAVRLARGQEHVHNSMLIHVTRFQNVQNQVTEKVQETLTEIKRGIEFGPAGDGGVLLGQLRRIWEQDYVPTFGQMAHLMYDQRLPQASWEEIKSKLYQAVTAMEVRQINGFAKDVLDYHEYKKGLSVIAIGGDKLSRGMTLEGLTVSYFTRTSRMYDTLMQMGRWFGYRDGYLDVCRLYTSPVLLTWYRHIAIATAELRNEFDLMFRKGLTPRDYGHRVITHPEGLLVTNVTKMRAARRTRIGYAGSITESVAFQLDPKIVLQNFRAFEQFLGGLRRFERQSNSILWGEIPGQGVAALFDVVSTPPASWKAQAQNIASFIRCQVDRGGLIRWTVVLKVGGTGQEFRMAGHSGRCVQRRNESNSQSLYQIGRLVSPSDEWLDLSEYEFQAALEKTRDTWERKGGTEPPKRPSGPDIRAQRNPENGLLLIYPVDPEDSGADRPLIGFALSFPADDRAETVEYLANSVYWEQEFD